MARKLFEKQGIRTRAGALATGTVFVVYTDAAGTALADISETSGGSAIAGSTVTVTDRAGLGLATLLFYGPTDGTDTLFLRCPADTSLGVQEVEADEDERLDALVAGSGIPPSLFDAKGDLIAASANDTPAKLTVGANDTVLTADSTAGAGVKWAAPAAAAGTAGGDLSGTYPNPQIGTGVIVNADVNAAAAIAYAKLALAASIVNADIAAGAAIAYSKLALTGAVLNADLAGSIAYSKLALTGAILNADLAGSIALSKLAVGVVEAQGGGKETLQAHGAMGSTETIDLANGNIHTGTMDAACTLTFTGSTASKGCSFTLILTQDATGSRIATWPATVKWAAGAAPTLSTGANKVDVLSFVTVDNGTTWLGFLAGADLR